MFGVNLRLPHLNELTHEDSLFLLWKMKPQWVYTGGTKSPSLLSESSYMCGNNNLNILHICYPNCGSILKWTPNCLHHVEGSTEHTSLP